MKKLTFWKNEAQNRSGIFWQNTIFWAKLLFKWRLLENFMLAWRTCSRYLKGPLNLALCVSNKNVIIRHVNEKNISNKPWFFTTFPLENLFKIKNFDPFHMKTVNFQRDNTHQKPSVPTEILLLYSRKTEDTCRYPYCPFLLFRSG